MKLIVLAKQVPDTKDQRFTDQHRILREGLDLIHNPYDEYAIEESVRLKERFGGSVLAVSMGNPSSIDILRYAISVGVDRGLFISDSAIAGSDLLGTAAVLSKAIGKNGPFDLILTGKQSSDGENGVIPSAIAEFLGLPVVMDVRKIVDVKDGMVIVEQRATGGSFHIEVVLPAVISIVKEINEPRLSSLKGKMAARSISIPTWSLKDLELNSDQVGDHGAQTKVVQVKDPRTKAGVKVFSGTVEEAVNQLVNELLDKKLL